MVRLDIYSKEVRNGLTPRNAYAKQQSISKVANEIGKVKESSPCRKKFAKYGGTVLSVYGTLRTLKIVMVF